MAKTAYFTDQDFEQFMAVSERNLKIQFYVCAVVSVIAQSGIWYILLTDENLNNTAYAILLSVSVVALLCLCGLGYCHFSVCRERKNYIKFRQHQQAEMNVLLDEFESARNKKLNAD